METTEMVGHLYKAPAKVLRSGGVAGGQSVLSWTAGMTKPATRSSSDARPILCRSTARSGSSGVGDNNHLQYPLRIGAADDIRILNVGIADISYIDKIVEFVGSTNPIVEKVCCSTH